MILVIIVLGYVLIIFLIRFYIYALTAVEEGALTAVKEGALTAVEEGALTAVEEGHEDMDEELQTNRVKVQFCSIIIFNRHLG